MTFFVEIRFWLEDQKVRCYENHISKNKLESIRYATL